MLRNPRRSAVRRWRSICVRRTAAITFVSMNTHQSSSSQIQPSGMPRRSNSSSSRGSSSPGNRCSKIDSLAADTGGVSFTYSRRKAFSSLRSSFSAVNSACVKRFSGWLYWSKRLRNGESNHCSWGRTPAEQQGIKQTFPTPKQPPAEKRVRMLNQIQSQFPECISHPFRCAFDNRPAPLPAPTRAAKAISLHYRLPEIGECVLTWGAAPDRKKNSHTQRSLPG